MIGNYIGAIATGSRTNDRPDAHLARGWALQKRAITKRDKSNR
jgi:hypothetical protein